MASIKTGRQRLEEYYPNALASTYKGVSGYIYFTETIIPSDFALQIPEAAASSEPVVIAGAEFVPDAYERSAGGTGMLAYDPPV